MTRPKSKSLKLAKSKRSYLLKHIAKNYPNHNDLMLYAITDVSKDIYSKFKNCKPISTELFYKICDRLGLDADEMQASAEEELDLESAAQLSDENSPGALVPDSVSETEAIMRSWDERLSINAPVPKKSSVLKNGTEKHSLSVPFIFEDYVGERTWLFSGREQVYKRIQDLIDQNDSGYFTVTGSPGSGKTAILAEYASNEARRERGIICVSYFAISGEGKTSVRDCLRSICASVIAAFGLERNILIDPDTGREYRFTNGDPLKAVLKAAVSRLQNKKLVIVIDALDELDISGNQGNILYLPEALPKQVYFLLSRRHYQKKDERMPVNSIKETVDITNKFKEDSEQSIRKYLEKFHKTDSSNYAIKLNQKLKTFSMRWEDFVGVVVDKSELNFMYVRHIVIDFADGKYDDIELRELPKGLEGYYERHWKRMDIEGNDISKLRKSSKELDILNELLTAELSFYVKFFVLFKLSKSTIQLSVETLCEEAQHSIEVNPNFDSVPLFKISQNVVTAIEDWYEFLQKSFETDDVTRTFRIYHNSFREFIEGKLKKHRGYEELILSCL